MDYNETYEREIDIKDLMFAVLRRWRLILACTLVLAVLLGGYKAVTTNAGQNNAESLKKAEDSYAKELEAYNRNLEMGEQEINRLTQSIASQQDYMEKSILMKTDPYDAWDAKAEIFVRLDEWTGDQGKDFTTTVMRAYQSALTSGEFLSGIAQQMGLDGRYIQELVSVTMRVDESGINSLNAAQDNLIKNLIMIAAQDNLITIQVRHDNEKDAKELLESVLAGINQFQASINSAVAPHTVRKVSSSVASKVDLNLADRQLNESNRLKVLKETLQAKTDEMDNLKVPTRGGAASPTVAGVKYGAIGGVLGGFMAVFFVCIGFVMSDKVYSAKELKYRFKIKILGNLPAETKNANKIDQWIDRLEGRVHDVDETHEWDLISANVCNYMEGLKSLLVSGNAQEEKVSQIASELSARLPGVKVMLGGNILHNVEGLRKLPECEGIVLVEQCGISLYRDVELEIERACDLHKAVVGCVVLGG